MGGKPEIYVSTDIEADGPIPGPHSMLSFASVALAGNHSHTRSAKKDIVDTAVAAGQFKTLVAAVQAAGLVDTLKGDGPFTVFAPTDEAFAKLPEGTVEALLKDKKKLAAILTYHVVSGKVMSTDLVTAASVKSLQGDSIDIGLKVDQATVVKADIQTTNGVIHVIDTVILPQS